MNEACVRSSQTQLVELRTFQDGSFHQHSAYLKHIVN